MLKTVRNAFKVEDIKITVYTAYARSCKIWISAPDTGS